MFETLTQICLTSAANSNKPYKRQITYLYEQLIMYSFDNLYNLYKN